MSTAVVVDAPPVALPAPTRRLGRAEWEPDDSVPLIECTVGELLRDRRGDQGKGSVHSWKYALSLEGCLKRSVENLKKWRDMFDPSWFLISRVSSQNTDSQLTGRYPNYRDSLSTLKDSGKWSKLLS